MKLAASAFALVLASGVAAYAQGTMSPNNPNSPAAQANPSASTHCWDMASNSLKSTSGKTLSQGDQSSAAAKSGTASSSTGGAAPTTGTTGSAPMARPAGIPNC